MIDAAATVDDGGNVTVFAVNRDLNEDACLKMDLRAFGNRFTKVNQSVLHHDDVNAVNTENNPNEVKPVDLPERPYTGEILLGKASWNVIRLS